ncbi:hypothetical protein [Rufibacter sp. XAAS-G3-1]|uniref:hypothetical protein n=1 Tax=Rufibacter sp. XAAS-G3-1 TaxID=2729134 RepID=UPI0015E68621|nr:hypothetical protein [Rufibacter sp. XAAS-G3-1]
MIGFKGSFLENFAKTNAGTFTGVCAFRPSLLYLPFSGRDFQRALALSRFHKQVKEITFGTSSPHNFPGSTYKTREIS